MDSGLAVFLTIAGMSLVTMGSRYLGFFVWHKPAAGRWRTAVHYLPYGLFAAIIAASAPTAADAEWLPLGAAALVTGVTAWRRWPLVLSLGAGFGIAVVLRFGLTG